MRKAKTILSIDPSITCLGYAHDAGGENSTGVVKPHKDARDMPRIMWVAERTAELVSQVKPDLVIYEGYAMGGKAAMLGKIFDRAELGGIIKRDLYLRHIPWLLVPPNSLKLFATGKGNANKDMVRDAMRQLSGRMLKTYDEADAYAMLSMGQMYCDPRRRPRDPRNYRLTALRGCSYQAGGN